MTKKCLTQKLGREYLNISRNKMQLEWQREKPGSLFLCYLNQYHIVRDRGLGFKT